MSPFSDYDNLISKQDLQEVEDLFNSFLPAKVDNTSTAAEGKLF